jgi:hypothetical protein
VPLLPDKIRADVSSSIVVIRDPRGWRDRARGYGVIIDGEQVAKIKRGQRIEVPITSGWHEVFMRINWGTSHRIGLDVPSGESIQLFCTTGNRQRGEGYIALTRDVPESSS